MGDIVRLVNSLPTLIRPRQQPALMELETDLSFSAYGDIAVTSLNGSGATASSEPEVQDINDEEKTQKMRQAFAKKWQKLGKGWQKRFLIGKCLPEGVKPPTAAAQQLASQSWVFGAKSGCGCLPCSKANNGTEWSLARAGLVPNFRAWFLEKHQESKSHIDAVKMMLGLGVDAPGAPPLEEFEALLKQLQSGSSLRSASNQFG